MPDHTIRPNTPVATGMPSSPVVPTPVNGPQPGGSSVRPSNPLASGRNAGASSTSARRVGLSAFPGKVLQTVMDHASASSRAALARTGRAMAAHVAIHAADAASDFAAAADKVLKLSGPEIAEAALALGERFATRIGHLPLNDVIPGCETVVDLLDKLPVSPENRTAAHGIGRSMLKATERAVDWMLHAPDDQSTLRDALSQVLTASLAKLSKAMRAHGMVHDESAMNGVLDQMMGPKGSLLTAQVALSELPQHALDLPNTPEGDAQTVRMMTKLAKDATSDAGLAALESDPSWGPFLADDRIGTILDRKGIDLADHPELKAAIDELRQKADEILKSAI